MKILDVKNTIPYPLDTGTNIASYQLLKVLSLEHEISFFGLAHSGEDEKNAEALRDLCKNVVVTPTPNRRSRLHRVFYKIWYLFRMVLTGKSLEESYSSPAVWRKTFREHMKKERYDLVIAEYWHNSWIFDLLPEGVTGALLIHDAAYVNNARMLRYYYRGILAPVVKLIYKRKDSREKKALEKAPHVIALSKDDIRHIQNDLPSLTDKTPAVLPLLLPPKRTSMDLPEGVIKHFIYFVGSTLRINNYDAAMHFCRDIMPFVLEEIPEALFYVVGRVTEQGRRSLTAHDGVKILWKAGEIDELLSDKGICVVPLRIGSGIKYKVLDAFALGKPVVTTSVGAEGITFYEDSSRTVQDDPRAFAHEVVRLIKNKEWYRELREKQLDFIKHSSSAETGSKGLSSILTKIVHSSNDKKVTADQPDLIRGG